MAISNHSSAIREEPYACGEDRRVLNTHASESEFMTNPLYSPPSAGPIFAGIFRSRLLREILGFPLKLSPYNRLSEPFTKSRVKLMLAREGSYKVLYKISFNSARQICFIARHHLGDTINRKTLQQVRLH
jgi:hypothetical protein